MRKKRTKRTKCSKNIALILTVCMIIALLPISVLADGEVYEEPVQEEILESSVIGIADEDQLQEDNPELSEMEIIDESEEADIEEETSENENDTADSEQSMDEPVIEAAEKGGEDAVEAAEEAETENAGESAESEELVLAENTASQLSGDESRSFSGSGSVYEGEKEVGAVYIYGELTEDAPDVAATRLEVTGTERTAVIESALSRIRGDKTVVYTAMFDISLLDADSNPLTAADVDGNVTVEIAEAYVPGYNREVKAYSYADGTLTAFDNEYCGGGSNSAYSYGKTAFPETLILEVYEKSFNICMTENTSMSFEDIFEAAGIDGDTSDITAKSVSNSEHFEITESEGNFTLVNKAKATAGDNLKITLYGVEITITLETAPLYENQLTDDVNAPQNDSSSAMAYYASDDGVDVIGIKKGNSIQTTYSNDGYETGFAVDGVGGSYRLNEIGKVYTINGIQIKLNCSIIDEGETVKFTYSVFNASNSTKTVSFGPNSDSMIGDNDGCAVTLTDGGQMIMMTDDHTGSCTSKGMTFRLTSDAATPFSGAWIGNYWERYDHLFECQADNVVTNEDSGLSAHWDVTLDPGTKATRSCYFNIKPCLVINNPILTADAETQKVNFDVPFTDAENRMVTLYYTLEGVDQQMAVARTGEGETEGTFQFAADASTWPANTYRTVQFYAVDNVGYESKHYTFNVFWPEFNPEKTYHTISFANTSSNIANVRNESGQIITLPTDSAEGKTFLGWNTKEDGTGTTYPGGSEYTMIDEDVTLYAQWKIPVANLTVTAENQYYTGEAVTPVVVSYGSQVLVPGQDYFVEYTNNSEIGTATARIYGGILEGETTVSFKITLANITDISVDASEIEFNGQPQKSVVTPTGTTSDGSPITFKYYLKGQDPSTATSEMPAVTDPGTHTIYYIASAPNHRDTIGSFEVTVNADLNSAGFNIETDTPYTGEDVDAKLVLKAGGRTLVEGIDYTIEGGVAEGKEIGEYSVTIKGKGDFEGTRTITWHVVPQKVEPLPEDDPQKTENNEKVLNDTWGEIQKKLSKGEELPDSIQETQPGIIAELLKSGNFSAAIRIEVSDITKTVPENEKKLAEAEAKKLSDTSSVEEYVDIKIVIYNAETDEVVGYITETEAPLDLSAEIDKAVSEKFEGRAAKVVRIHNEKATLLDGTLTENEVGFSSDKFSTYGIISTEKPAIATGDSNSVVLYIILAIAAVCLGGAAFFFRSKKCYRR